VNESTQIELFGSNSLLDKSHSELVLIALITRYAGRPEQSIVCGTRLHGNMPVVDFL
jgi:hypothetical protein